MTALLAVLSPVLFAGYAFAGQPSLAPTEPTTDAVAPKPDPKAAVVTIFAAECMGCHGGETPAAKLSLEAATFEAALVDVAATEIDTLKLVDTAKLQRSYLLMKLRADKRIRANPMPLRAPALEPSEISAVELWIAKLVNIAAVNAQVRSLGTAIPRPADATAPAPQAPTTDARKPPDSGGAANR